MVKKGHGGDGGDIEEDGCFAWEVILQNEGEVWEGRKGIVSQI